MNMVRKKEKGALISGFLFLHGPEKFLLLLAVFHRPMSSL